MGTALVKINIYYFVYKWVKGLAVSDLFIPYRLQISCFYSITICSFLLFFSKFASCVQRFLVYEEPRIGPTETICPKDNFSISMDKYML